MLSPILVAEAHLDHLGFKGWILNMVEFLGQIADAMYEWEGPIAEQLELTRADVAAIKSKYPGELRLQT